MGRILVSEDVPRHGEALAEFLREAGHEVFRVDAGSKAIAAAYDVRPELVLFDVVGDVRRALTVASTLAWVDDLRVVIVTKSAPAPTTDAGVLFTRSKAWIQAPALDGELLRRVSDLLQPGVEASGRSGSWRRR